MAEEPKKKKGKKPGTGQKIAYGVGGLLVLYFGYRWYQNRGTTAAAASPAGIDPLTGNAYQAGVGSLAPGGSGGGTTTTTGTTTDPTIDPSTGQTWASEIAAAGAAGGIDPATGQTYSSEIGANSIDPLTGNTYLSELNQGPPSGGYDKNSVNPVGATGTGTNTDTTSLAAWRTEAIARVAKATGLDTKQAGQQVALYLEGKPLTHAGAVNSLHNIAFSSPAPITSGHLPLPVLSKHVTQAAPPEARTAPAAAPKEAQSIAAVHTRSAPVEPKPAAAKPPAAVTAFRRAIANAPTREVPRKNAPAPPHNVHPGR